MHNNSRSNDKNKIKIKNKNKNDNDNYNNKKHDIDNNMGDAIGKKRQKKTADPELE